MPEGRELSIGKTIHTQDILDAIAKRKPWTTDIMNHEQIIDNGRCRKKIQQNTRSLAMEYLIKKLIFGIL